MGPTLVYIFYRNKGILVCISERILENKVFCFFNTTKQTYQKPSNTSFSHKSNNYLDICLEVSGKISVIQLAFGLHHVSWNISHGRRKSFYQPRCHVAFCVHIINANWLLLSCLCCLVLLFCFVSFLAKLTGMS